jgi:hypothetical protein
MKLFGEVDRDIRVPLRRPICPPRADMLGVEIDVR